VEIIDREILDKVKDSIYEIAEEIMEEDSDSNNKLINNWNKIQRLFFDFNNNCNWPMHKNSFMSIFDLNRNTLNTHIKRLRREGLLKHGADYIIEDDLMTTHIYETGAKKILERMHSIEGAKYLFNKYGINNKVPPCFSYITIIEYAVRGFDDAKKEYSTINRYRIDLYLQNKKLAVECDERGHEDENLDKRDNREQAIKNELGCRFLRFDAHEPDFKLGKVIKVIFYYIFNKLINGQDPIDYYMGQPTAEELAMFE
jgi:hypothetical protein